MYVCILICRSIINSVECLKLHIKYLNFTSIEYLRMYIAALIHNTNLHIHKGILCFVIKLDTRTSGAKQMNK